MLNGNISFSINCTYSNRMHNRIEKTRTWNRRNDAVVIEFNDGLLRVHDTPSLQKNRQPYVVLLFQRAGALDEAHLNR